MAQVKRREFITFFGCAAAWPLAARGQQGQRVRRIAVLMGSAGTAPDQANVAVLLKRLNELGWQSDRNMRADVRWWTGAPEQMRSAVAEMLSLSPEVIVVFTNLALAVLKPLVVNVPIVFVGVGDPVGSGFVASLAHPGGNITGFTSHEGPMGGKWLEVLKEAAPSLARVITIFHPETPVHQSMWRSVQDAAPHFGVEVAPGAVHDAAEIKNAIAAFAAKGGGGLIVLPHALAVANRELLIELQLRHSLPALDSSLGAVQAGGLVSYGVDFRDSFRRAASYVDRILKGEKPADLPVQAPTKYELVINLRTAKALGLELPATLLARADEVIE